MSSWSEILLTATLVEESEDGPPDYWAIDIINSWLREAGWCSGLFLIRHPEDEHAPHACFAGAFKNLDVEAFIAAVKAASWRWPHMVQLFIRHEDDRGFQEIDLKAVR